MFDIQMVDQPKATYKVEFQELSQTEEYKEYKILQRVWMGILLQLNMRKTVLIFKQKSLRINMIQLKGIYQCNHW